MELTEQIQLKWSPALSALCHRAKNLYNAANWEYRQFFFHLGEFLNYYDLCIILKNNECYKALPAQTSEQILQWVMRNWKAYWAALRSLPNFSGTRILIILFGITGTERSFNPLRSIPTGRYCISVATIHFRLLQGGL
jgi:hypothetical protein